MDNGILRQDKLVGGLAVTDTVHNEIHEGHHFTFSRTKVMDNVTANTVIIQTPASTVGIIHLVYDAQITAAGSFTFSEAPEASAGSTLTAYNNDRSSTSTSGCVITGGVVWTSAGTVFETLYVGANNPAVKTGGGVEVRNEWILKPSTQYGFRVTNVAATCYSTINAYFYLVSP